MEILIELLFEFLLEVLWEILAELGLHSVGEAFHRREKRNPFLAFIGYALLGLIAGGLSLLFFPRSFMRSERFHGIGLVIIPLMGGAVMAGIGMLRRKRGQELIRLDSFAYGAVFAFGVALIRFLFTK